MDIVNITLGKLTRIPDDVVLSTNINFKNLFERTEFDSIIFLIKYTIKSDNTKLKLIVHRTLNKISKSLSDSLICNIIDKESKDNNIKVLVYILDIICSGMYMSFDCLSYDTLFLLVNYSVKNNILTIIEIQNRINKMSFHHKLLILSNICKTIDESIHYNNTLFLILDSLEFKTFHYYELHKFVTITGSNIIISKYVFDKIKNNLRINDHTLPSLCNDIFKNYNNNNNDNKDELLAIEISIIAHSISIYNSGYTIESLLCNIVDISKKKQILYNKVDDIYNIIELRKIQALNLASNGEINMVEQGDILTKQKHKRKYLISVKDAYIFDSINKLLEINCVTCSDDFYTYVCNTFLESDAVITDHSSFSSIYNFIIIKNRYQFVFNFFERNCNLNIILFDRISKLMNTEKYIDESLIFFPNDFIESDETINIINTYLFLDNKFDYIFYSKFCEYILQSEIIAKNYIEVKTISDALIVELKYGNMLVYVNKYSACKPILFRATSLIFLKKNYEAIESKNNSLLTDDIISYIVTYLI
jgi:hypothetical protein